jgi:LasA protease
MAFGALVLALAAPALAAGGTVTGTGGCLYERTAPGVSSLSIGCLPDGTTVNVVCQDDFGPDYAVNGHWGRTAIWDFIDANGGGWVSDGFVDTGSNSFVAPSCF